MDIKVYILSSNSRAYNDPAMAHNNSTASTNRVSPAVLHKHTPLVQTIVPREGLNGRPPIRRAVDDLFNENRAPTYNYLARFKSVNLTDEAGTQYWLAEDVKWNKGFVEAIMKSSEVEGSDLFFWIRPAKPKTQEERAMYRGNSYLPPVADPYTPYTFYHEEQDFMRTLQGYIVMSGADAPCTRNSRKSSWVVVRNLTFV